METRQWWFNSYPANVQNMASF